MISFDRRGLVIGSGRNGQVHAGPLRTGGFGFGSHYNGAAAALRDGETGCIDLGGAYPVSHVAQLILGSFFQTGPCTPRSMPATFSGQYHIGLEFFDKDDGLSEQVAVPIPAGDSFCRHIGLDEFGERLTWRADGEKQRRRIAALGPRARHQFAQFVLDFVLFAVRVFGRAREHILSDELRFGAVEGSGSGCCAGRFRGRRRLCRCRRLRTRRRQSARGWCRRRRSRSPRPGNQAGRLG